MLKYVGEFLAGAAIGGILGGSAILLADYMSERDKAKREKYIADNGLTGHQANLARVAWELNNVKKHAKK